MPSQTNEQALEATIEKALTGTCVEELKKQGQWGEPFTHYRTGEGYYVGYPNDYNKELALDEKRFWHFLESTQSEELEKLQKQPQYKLRVMQRLDRLIKKYGILRVLRKGLDVDDAHFTLFYVAPLASSSQPIKDLFASNEFSVTRQVRYSAANPAHEIDIVVFVNGLPIITIELKNPWTGQTARHHGINQYKFKRDATQPLLQFGRCVVHMTVDTDEIFMCTHLKGKPSYFLPFNKGTEDHSAGNPVNPAGHKTAYLWEEVLTRRSVANILQHFVRFDGKSTDPLKKRTLFFPRYHQLDVVRKILAHASQHGVGQTYLIQHSAGSGKSNSITWAAFQLIETYPEREGLPGSKGIDTPLFDSVIVVTDRRLLDKQIRENIKEFSQVKNIIAPAYSSKDLRAALESGKKIIISTIQKFPFIVDGISDMSDKRFAVVIDEAHSSQSGLAHDNMNRAMGKKKNEDEDPDVFDAQDHINEVMRSRKMRRNASYLAFTATPKPNTLEKFGTPNESGGFDPFHLYSMKQAIEEGFIHDVLRNYTTYKSYYEIQKSIMDNPLFDTAKAQKKLKAYVESHRETIATKAEIMVEQFLTQVVNKKKLKGKAKGMVVTQSIASAIRYFYAIQKILSDKGNPFRVAIAFSGKKTVKGIKGTDHTEDSINNFPASLDTAKPTDPDYISDKIARYFDMDEYRLLVVANKYLTGFDQPKLCTMFVDKKLQGVLAVQALSRLNRAANKYDKKTEDIFILDFFNSATDIKAAFDPYYTSTTLNTATDVNVLHELKDSLDEVGVYEWGEVEYFVEKYFSGVDAQELSPIIDVPAARFNAQLDMDDKAKADYKIKAKQFVKIYGQMASIMPFEMVTWEKLFWFLKFLIPKLLIKDKAQDALDGLLNAVDLSTYGLERTKLNTAITLDAQETELDPQNPNPRSAHGGDEEQDPLDLIIQSFNERWFQGWEATPEEQRVKFVSLAKHIRNNPDYQKQVVNNPDQQNRELALLKMIDEAIRKQRRNELEMYKLYSQDDAFRVAMRDTIRRVLGL